MSGVFNGSSTRHTRIGPSGSITYPFAGGWTIFFMFEPEASQPNSKAHLYSHNVINVAFDSINIFQESSFIKLRIETPTQIPASNKPTSNTVNTQVWNAFAATWDGVNFNLYLNGVQTVVAPAGGTATYTPPDQVTIGMAADLSTNEYNGKICHVSKLSRPLTSGEGQKYTDVLVSPRFAQNSLDFHLPMWNSDFNFDEQQVQTVTTTSMVYGQQAPAKHPCKSSTNVDDLNIAPTAKRRAYFFIG